MLVQVRTGLDDRHTSFRDSFFHPYLKSIYTCQLPTLIGSALIQLSRNKAVFFSVEVFSFFWSLNNYQNMRYCEKYIYNTSILRVRVFELTMLFQSRPEEPLQVRNERQPDFLDRVEVHDLRNTSWQVVDRVTHTVM